jgi:hypothetical protein
VSTLDKVAAEARGPYVLTLLIGKALEAVEHMDPSVYQCKDGEKADVAEILAATWEEKRAELTQLQKSRRFAEAKESRRSF